MCPSDVLYHINTIEEASNVFQSVVPVLKLEDHIESFKLSIKRAPIDTTIDIIRFFLTNMQTQYLPKLGNPRNLYAGKWLKALQGTQPPAIRLPDQLLFL